MEKLNEFDFARKQTAPKYPVEELLNGEIWKCLPGVDFTSKPSSFAQTLYNYGRKLGKKVRTQILSDGAVIVQAYDKK